MKDLESLIQKAGNHDARAFEQIYRLTSREIGIQKAGNHVSNRHLDLSYRKRSIC